MSSIEQCSSAQVSLVISVRCSILVGWCWLMLVDSSFHIFGRGFHGSNCLMGWWKTAMIILGRLVLRRLDGWRRDAKCAKCCRVNSKIWPSGSRANCRSTVILYQTKTIEVYSWHLLATVRCGISQNMSEEDIRRLHRLDPGNPKVRSPFAILQVAQERNWFISWLDVTVQNGAVCAHGWSIKLQTSSKKHLQLSTKHAGGQLFAAWACLAKRSLMIHWCTPPNIYLSAGEMGLQHYPCDFELWHNGRVYICGWLLQIKEKYTGQENIVCCSHQIQYREGLGVL